MRVADLMEMSDESLGLIQVQVRDELARRKVTVQAIPLHAGNLAGGKPAPLLLRVVEKIPTLSPANLAKVEALIDGLTTKPA